MSDHKGEAELWLKTSKGRSIGESVLAVADATAAQVHAILYLADQQRIANLIAVGTWNNRVLNSGEVRRPGDEEIDLDAEWAQVERIFIAVREGLGLA